MIIFYFVGRQEEASDVRQPAVSSLGSFPISTASCLDEDEVDYYYEDRADAGSPCCSRSALDHSCCARIRVRCCRVGVLLCITERGVGLLGG
jgi:hypothetical protein